MDQDKPSNKFSVFIEVLIGTVLAAVFIGIAVYALPNTTDKEKQKNTIRDMKSISDAISIYKASRGSYPVCNDIQELAEKLSPEFINELTIEDSWGQNFYFKSSSSTYTLGTGAKDWDGSSPLIAKPKGPFNATSYDNDIIIKDGIFVQYPSE